MNGQWGKLQTQVLTRKDRSTLFSRAATNLALGSFTLVAVFGYILLRT